MPQCQKITFSMEFYSVDLKVGMEFYSVSLKTWVQWKISALTGRFFPLNSSFSLAPNSTGTALTRTRTPTRALTLTRALTRTLAQSKGHWWYWFKIGAIYSTKPVQFTQHWWYWFKTLIFIKTVILIQNGDFYSKRWFLLLAVIFII